MVEMNMAPGPNGSRTPNPPQEDPMNRLVKISMLAPTVVAVIGLSGGVAIAQGATTSGTWPTAYPLPTSPGRLISQSSTKAAVRSTDTTSVVMSKLDYLYVTQKHCTQRFVVNKPKDYLCSNATTRKTDEVYFVLAALDPTASDPSRSQTTAFLVTG
jgi:hypothetical protein